MLLELDFTVQGLGGYILQGRGCKPHTWIVNRGGVGWSVFAAQWNFELMNNPYFDWRPGTVGSFLSSSPFALNGLQKLTVSASVITADFEPYNDVGFALLVQGAAIQEVLFALRPDGSNENGGGPGPTIMFAPPSPGVSVNPIEHNTLMNIVLAGVNYGDTTVPFHGSGYLDVSPDCVPAAGSYQLVVGMFNTGGGNFNLRPSALIVRSVEVT
ncbi:MAG: hypothetical protein WB608_25630 [Terracidiphilus sp.]